MAATTAQLTVDANTIGLWHMDGTVGSAGKKDNAEGTAAYDLTEVNSPTAVDGQIVPTSNGAYQNSATDNFIRVANNAAFDVANITIEGWFKTTASDCGFCDRYVGAGNRTFFSRINANGTLSFTFYDTGGSNQQTITSTVAVNTGQWVYFAYTYDKVNQKLYINPTSSTPDASVSDNFDIFTGYTGTFNIGTGNAVFPTDPTIDVDEWRYSNIARTGADIFAYYFVAANNSNFFNFMPN